jgi:DNA-binding response OmpR family regulator
MSMSKGHILLVEDNEIAGKVVKMMLEHLEYTCCIATSSAAAINSINNTAYDLIIMDVGLPDLDGISTLKIIKNTVKNIPPIVMLTAYSDDKYQSQIEKLDIVSTYMIKPLTMDSCLKMLKSVMLNNDCLTELG